MSKKYSIEDFWGKVQWGGGLGEAAGYGVESSDIADKKLAKLWKDYLKVYQELEKHSDKIHDYLREKGIEEA